MALFNEDDVFGYKDANEIKKFWAASQEPDPADVEEGEIYLDIAALPYRLKRYNGSKWETVGGVPSGTDDPAAADSTNGDLFLNTLTTPPRLKRFSSTANTWQDVALLSDTELLNALENVHGPGSGLDADTVDGAEASSLLRSDADDSFSGTLTSTIGTETVVEFNGADSRITIHDGSGNFNIKSGVDDDNIVTGVDGGSKIRLDHNDRIYCIISTAALGTTFTSDIYIYIDTTGINFYGPAITDHLLLPLSAPADLANGSMWIE